MIAIVSAVFAVVDSGHGGDPGWSGKLLTADESPSLDCRQLKSKFPEWSGTVAVSIANNMRTAIDNREVSRSPRVASRDARER